MLKYLTFACFLYLNINLVAAQAGFYRYTGKDFTETLELLENGQFIYSNLQPWAKGQSKGTWKVQSDILILHSDKQISYEIIEEEDKKAEALYLTITAKSVDNGPRKIEKIKVNNEANMSNDNANSLAYLEQYNRINTMGTRQQRDSLKNAFVPRHYVYDDYEGFIDSLNLSFDKQELSLQLKNPKSNRITIVFDLDTNPMYRYFNQQKWQFLGKKEILSPEGYHFKKAKK